MNDYERLRKIAIRAMRERGLSPDFPIQVQQQLATIDRPATTEIDSIRDLRHLVWCSIDNDDSLDLDQLTAIEQIDHGGFALYVAIADVDALVSKESPIDLHAQINTTSVYTAVQIFPMLPEKLSTNLTSLNESVDRLSVVFEILLNANMEIQDSKIYRAIVNNKAKLTYSSVGSWLEGRSALPKKIATIPGLAESLKMQNQLAQELKRKRHLQGALTFETREIKSIIDDGKVSNLLVLGRNQAHELIENLMITANTASARFSKQQKIPSLRRVVRVPQRWDRIVDLASDLGKILPQIPNAKALDEFLAQMKESDPETFPDLSLSIIKLLGSGEYVLEAPGEESIGHFGLALRDYTHSTAPNRRYPDIITQRLIKASLQNLKMPYSNMELRDLAKLCTQREDAVAKVERSVKKSAAAIFLADRIGETFLAVVTGASDKGTWVRLHEPPIEGMLVSGRDSLDVGDRIQVKLVRIDIDRGFIDFIHL